MNKKNNNDIQFDLNKELRPFSTSLESKMKFQYSSDLTDIMNYVPLLELNSEIFYISLLFL
jgi:hypothetical protein